jgi:putative membrane protein
VKPEDVDATRRTWLALERTQLAWWRTGMTAIAVGIGVGRIVPELQDTSNDWGYVALGVAFVVYGIALIAYGTARERHLSVALEAGRPGFEPSRVDLGLTFGGVVLGIATALLILLA